MNPRISTLADEGVFQAAKYLKIQALVNGDELSLLLDALQPLQIYSLSGAFSLDEFPTQNFLSTYSSWIEKLKTGIPPSDLELRSWRALAWTRGSESIWLQEIPGAKFLAKPCQPFVQVQVHHMNYSSVDGEFRSMVFAQDSIFWGLQFSFPQVCQDAKTGELKEVKDSPNAELFQLIRRWSRDYTVPTPILVDQRRVNLPVRLGKRCFPWIHCHPQLKHQVLELSYGN